MSDDDYEWMMEDVYLGIGSTHSLSDKPCPPRVGPQVRLGFQPPELAWLPLTPIKRGRKAVKAHNVKHKRTK